MYAYVLPPQAMTDVCACANVLPPQAMTAVLPLRGALLAYLPTAAALVALERRWPAVPRSNAVQWRSDAAHSLLVALSIAASKALCAWIAGRAPFDSPFRAAVGALQVNVQANNGDCAGPDVQASAGPHRCADPATCASSTAGTAPSSRSTSR